MEASCEVIETDPSGRYLRFDDLIGVGASKSVFKGFDQAEGTEIAWSRINFDAELDLDLLRAEADLLKSLDHPNIMKFRHSWVDERAHAFNIVTELFDSGSVSQYRRKHRHVEPRALKGWATQILTGLDYLHTRDPPIIHRDLKCDNLFINGSRGEIKIGDFGLATAMEGPSATTLVGTPQFIAPELYDEDYNELADIYSFGMCVLEMVTCAYPYSECHNPAQIFKKVVSGVRPKALGTIEDLEVKGFIEKCLAPKEQRPSARELLKDPFLRLEDIADTIQVQTQKVPRLPFELSVKRFILPGRCIPIELVGVLDVVVDDGVDQSGVSTVGAAKRDYRFTIQHQFSKKLAIL